MFYLQFWQGITQPVSFTYFPISFCRQELQLATALPEPQISFYSRKDLDLKRIVEDQVNFSELFETYIIMDLWYQYNSMYMSTIYSCTYLSP